MKILNDGNYKTSKGEKVGWKTYGIHLAPSNLSGKNVCYWASEGCTAACLNLSGMGIFANVQKARIEKTQLFFENREAFMAQLHAEIASAITKAEKEGMRPCFRLNLTSDIAWESIKYKGKSILAHFPSAQFYDYTKGATRILRYLSGKMPKNYHLTFSRSESNAADVDKVLAAGGNVAAVFRGSLPAKWKGKRVISGDNDDLRFLDPHNVIVGLTEKGLAKKDASGFVLEGGAK